MCDACASVVRVVIIFICHVHLWQCREGRHWVPGNRQAAVITWMARGERGEVCLCFKWRPGALLFSRSHCVSLLHSNMPCQVSACGEVCTVLVVVSSSQLTSNRYTAVLVPNIQLNKEVRLLSATVGRRCNAVKMRNLRMFPLAPRSPTASAPRPTLFQSATRQTM